MSVSLITDPYFYAIAIPAVMLYGMGKGGMGPGAGAVVVPLLSLVISPVQAAAIMLPILCVMDIFAIHTFRRRYDREQLKILVPAALVGIVVGVATMNLLPVRTLKLMIGVIAIVFFLNYLLKRSTPNINRSRRWKGYFWGALSGFTSAQIHAGGPPVTVYLLPLNLDKTVLIGTMAVFFTIVNYVKLVPYTLLGLFDTANLLTSLVLVPLAPIGVRCGYLLMQRISQPTIYRFLYGMLLVSGLKLCYDGLLGG